MENFGYFWDFQNPSENGARCLDRKVQRAIRLLKSFAANEAVELCFSGGKDSEVILELAKMANIHFVPIYKNTTIDPPGTIAHCQRKGINIVQPKKTFFELVQNGGLPTMRGRFCCQVLKEYKIMDKAIQGVRAAESIKRAARYDVKEPIICRIYRSKKNRVQVCLPIIDWTDSDVEEFIKKRNIQCHPLYYDEQGNFCVQRRLGCLGCPLRGDRGEAHFLQYPRLFYAWMKNAKIWWDTHPNTSTRRKFPDIYAVMAHNMFYANYNEFLTANNSMFGAPDWKTILEKHFNVQLL